VYKRQSLHTITTIFNEATDWQGEKKGQLSLFH
jgi:hypothetical protein